MKSTVLAILAIGLAFLTLDASAQVATGTYPFGTYSNGPDVINLGNLNTTLTIPVLNKTGRGSNFPYNIIYNSAIWSPVASSSGTYWTPVNGFGWQPFSEAAYISYTMTTSSGTCGMRGQYSWQSWTFNNVYYADQFGKTHLFSGVNGSYINSPGTADQCPPAGAQPSGGLSNIPAPDGSGLLLSVNFFAGYITANLTTSSGATITAPLNPNSAPPSSWSYSSEDNNGNLVTGTGTGTSGTYTDTTGTTALSITTGSSTVTMAFANSTASATSSGASKVVITYAGYNIQTHFQCTSPTINEYSGSANLVSQIAQPDGSTYKFTYEQTPGYSSSYTTGRIASIQLPSGNTITYTYPVTNDGVNCADGSTSGLTRTLASDSGSAAQTWTYARTHRASAYDV